MEISRDTEIGGSLAAVGFVVALVGACWFFVSELQRGRPDTPEGDGPLRGGYRLDRAWLAALVIVLAVGAAVRVTGLDTKGLSHPEAIVLGLDLPADISMPPPRHGLAETAVWHFFVEEHPFGYYLGMWLWTQIFGASLLSIQAPEALLGVLSIHLVYRVGRLAYGAHVGVVAAALLALHGFHVYWSQAARSFAPGACLGLLSTALLLEMARGSRARPWREAAYVLTTVVGTMTVKFYWPFLVTQMLWATLRDQGSHRRPPRLAVVQSLAFMLAAPMLAHSVMLAWVPDIVSHSPNGGTALPSFGFLAQYFSFGFLLQHGAYEGGELDLPQVASAAILALAVVLLAFGLWLGTRSEEPPFEAPDPPSGWPLALAAVGTSITVLGFAFVADRRRELLAVMSLLPLAMSLAPWAVGLARAAIARLGPGLRRMVGGGGQASALIVLLAGGPTLVLFVLSSAYSFTAPRPFLQFVPYLMLLTAAGAWQLGRRRVVAATLAVVLGLLFASSTVVLRRTPMSTRDYQGLARALAPAIQPADLVFTPSRHWAYTPDVVVSGSRSAYRDGVRGGRAPPVASESLGARDPCGGASDLRHYSGALGVSGGRPHRREGDGGGALRARSLTSDRQHGAPTGCFRVEPVTLAVLNPRHLSR